MRSNMNFSSDYNFLRMPKMSAHTYSWSIEDPGGGISKQINKIPCDEVKNLSWCRVSKYWQTNEEKRNQKIGKKDWFHKNSLRHDQYIKFNQQFHHKCESITSKLYTKNKFDEFKIDIRRASTFHLKLNYRFSNCKRHQIKSRKIDH
jgi:hypothetical protein